MTATIARPPDETWTGVPPATRLLLAGVEGDPERGSTRRLLEAVGWRVRVERDLAGMVDALQRGSPRAVVLVSDGDFSTVIERLRVVIETREHRRIPVLVLAGTSNMIALASLVYAGAAAAFPAEASSEYLLPRLAQLAGVPESFGVVPPEFSTPPTDPYLG